MSDTYHASGKQSAEPDFAFPETVEKNAKADLEKALKANDGPGAVDAVIRMGLAKSAINTDSIGSVVKMVEQVAEGTSDPGAKALLYSLEATIYTQVFRADAWTYSSRPPIADAGEDYKLWGKGEFMDKVGRLVDSSLADAQQLRGLNILDYKGVVDISREDASFFPSLYDFIALQGIRNLTVFADTPSGQLSVLNEKLLSDPLDRSLYPGKTCRPLAEILELYASLIEANGDKPAARFYDLTLADEFIASHLFAVRQPMPRGRIMPIYDEEPEEDGGELHPYNREMLRLYNMYCDNEFSALFLKKAAGGFSPGKGAADICALASNYLKRFSGSMFADDIANILIRLENPSVSISVPGLVKPDEKVEIAVKSVNCRKATVKFYNVTALQRGNRSADYVRGLAGLNPFQSVDVEFADSVPFSAERKIEMAFPEYGMYVAQVVINGKKKTEESRIIRCSDLSLATMRVGEEQSAWVVDPASGSPVAGASLSFSPWSRKSGMVELPGRTNSNGEEIFEVSEYGELFASRGQDRYSDGVSVTRPSGSRSFRNLSVSLFTSLGIYRPGDEVDFSLVAFYNMNNRREIAANARLGVMLFDANYQPVDTLVVTTDSWGRAEGKFTLPSAGLTGNFSLNAGKMDGDRITDRCGSHSFMVSDYKLPTFSVKELAVNRPASVTQGASIEGEAVAYSGFPVADAKVKASVKVQTGYWWWRTESPVFFTTETATDAAGKFTVVIPADAIGSSPAPGGFFRVEIEVTSADGETRTLSSGFNLGKPYTIDANVPREINLDKPFSVKVSASAPSGKVADIPLRYAVSSDEKVVAEGSYAADGFADVVKSLPTGSYSAVFSAADSTQADATMPVEFMVYRSEDAACPVALPLWVPSTSVETDASGKAQLSVGSDCSDAYVRMVVTAAPGKVLRKCWLRPAKGVHSVEVSLPQGVDKANVELSCVKNFKNYTYTTEVTRADSRKSVKVEIESFRDKVTPGQMEKITLRVKPVGDVDAESAVLLDMSNKAIDVLASNPIYLPGFTPEGWIYMANGWSFGNIGVYNTANVKYKNDLRVSQPDFNLYGLTYTSGGYRIRGARNMMSRSMKIASSANLKEESVEMMATDMAMPMMAAGAADGGIITEAEMEESAEDVTSYEAKTSDNTEEYRPAEIPLAFFRPMLVTAPDGTLEISYEVPDANTTWVLRAMAYNKQLLSSTAETEIVASKPVMVSANAPRFLRTADSAILAATVMNNSGEAGEVIVRSEVLSASDNSVVSESTDTLSLASGASAVVKVGVDVPVASTGLIFRVKATMGDYVDGEQSLIPVLASEQDVIESEIFFLAPDQSSFSMELPEMKGDDRAYLNFTENPSWQVVTALPGLRDNKINSSVEAAAALFSACVAENILKENPEIARVLRHWLDNPEDSALVSSLQKNSQIKQMLLSSTPWVSEALSDSERMQRLALLFDRGQTNKVISEAIDQLAKTHMGGGWCWTSAYPEVSQWATEVVLSELGLLNKMGCLPADRRLRNMVREACAYLDSETVKEFRKYPESDYWLYVKVRDCFPEIKMSTAASRVVEAQVQRCLREWRDASIPLKGIYAQILNSHGYNASARQVLASLREFATITKEKGMWWQQLDRYSTFWSYNRVGITSILLDAFNEVEPGCKDIDLIRQWLIINKTNNDWGSAVMTTETVAAILRSGKPLKVNTRCTAIHIGDKLVEPSSPEYATGAFTEQITSMLKAPAVMTIDRQADYPSVGGVVMMRRLPMDSIKSVDCKEIAVEKSLSVFDGEKWVAGDSFKVGDRVRVELQLKVEDDLSYVVVSDLRAAGLEPAEQLPAPIMAEGLWFYRENRDSQTNIFIDFLPRGTYRLVYELFASQAGSFSSGVAEVQSQYNPIVAAHSGGMTVTVK